MRIRLMLVSSFVVCCFCYFGIFTASGRRSQSFFCRIVMRAPAECLKSGTWRLILTKKLLPLWYS